MNSRKKGAFKETEKTEFYNGVLIPAFVVFSNDITKLKEMSEDDLLNIFRSVPMVELPMSDIDEGLDMIAAMAAKTNFLGSNGEARRELKQNAISLNKEKVKEDRIITKDDLINNQFLLLQKGKKNYYVIRVK